MKFFKPLCTVLLLSILLGSWNILSAQNIKPVHPATPAASSSYSTLKQCRRGGQLNTPKGIENKYFMFNVTGGVALPGMDATNTEYCKIAYFGSIGLYGVLRHTKTIALGLHFDYYYLNATKKPAYTEYQHLISYQLHDWVILNAHVSFLGNVKIKNRFSVQFPINLGPSFVFIPENNMSYAKAAFTTQGAQNIIYSKKYIKDMAMGFSAKIGLQITYALSRNVEIMCGADWNYLRFKLEEQLNNDAGFSINKSIRQFSLIGFKLGIAASF